MKSPSQIAADLRSLASEIERSNRPPRTLVASDIKRVLMAMDSNVNMHYTICDDVDEMELPDNGNLSVELDKLLSQFGASVVNWDHDSGLVISYPPDKFKAVDKFIWEMKKGSHGSEGLVDMVRLYESSSL